MKNKTKLSVCYISSLPVTNYSTLVFFADGIPEDFSIIATFKAKKKTNGYMFIIYSNLMSKELLGLYITKKSAKFIYEDQHGNPGKTNAPTFEVNMADGK